MSNIKTSNLEWSVAKEYFEAGLSLSKIEKKTGISRSALSKKSHSDGWSKETGKDVLIQQDIQLKLAKETLNETALMVHDELVNERTTHIQFFNNGTIKNLSIMLNKIDETTTINEHRIAQSALNDGRDNVLGKTPETAIQINNTNVNERSDLDKLRRLSPQELEYIEDITRKMELSD